MGLYWTVQRPNTSTCSSVHVVAEKVPTPLVVQETVPVGACPETLALQFTAVPTGTGEGWALDAEQVTLTVVSTTAVAWGMENPRANTTTASKAKPKAFKKG